MRVYVLTLTFFIIPAGVLPPQAGKFSIALNNGLILVYKLKSRRKMACYP